MAEQMIGATQNPSNVLDMSTFQLAARRSAANRLFVMFQSFGNKMLNLYHQINMTAATSNQRTRRLMQAYRLTLLAIGMTGAGIAADALLGGGGDDKDRKPFFLRAAIRLLRDLFNMLPGGSRLFSTLQASIEGSGFSAARRNMNPVDSAVTDAITAAGDTLRMLADGKDNGKKWNDTAKRGAKAAGVLLGYPVSAPMRFAE